MTLRDLKVGQRAIVRSLHADRSMAQRLMEMGFVPGTEVRAVRLAPLGDPMELRLRGYSLTLRRSEAATVQIDHVQGT
ncbi:MAG: ferrous iron transport protein A [Myxococcales bacterium]|nr:ferrous iron transport protein A [Myxococcales bacterium]